MKPHAKSILRQPLILHHRHPLLRSAIGIIGGVQRIAHDVTGEEF
jgi:hypothetical protein